MPTPWLPAQRLDPDQFAAIRRRTVFECCKWDPQIEDTPALADFALVLRADAWREVATAAAALYHETLAAEAALFRRPHLHRQLALPRAIRSVLRHAGNRPPAAGIARLMRFDFHWSTEGWRVSEVNSDVPGGFIEAGGFAGLMAGACGAGTLGDPAHALAASLARYLPPHAAVALVHATAYVDDRQVMFYLADRLVEVGLKAVLCSPGDLQWRGGTAHPAADPRAASPAAIVRFFPAEWLANLPRASGWPHFFVGGTTPQCNPATALLTQSKRWPLIWDQLDLALPAWQRYLPAAHDPRAVDWLRCDEWVLKPALGRVGEAVGLAGVTPPRLWRSIRRAARWFPAEWVAQRRFEAVPLEGPSGPVYPCVGVFVQEGVVTGVYGRVARLPLIDSHASDIAVLVERGIPTPRRREACHAFA